MKIAIFSGSIPSSIFVEHLIRAVAKEHRVMLFGVINEKTDYNSTNIKLYRTPHSHVTNLLFTVFRSLILLLKRPKHFLIIFNESRRYPNLYEKWIWFSKFIPIATYSPDIIHFQWARDLDFYYFFKEKLGYKVILSLRGAHINYTPIIEPRIADLYRQSFPLIDGFHAVSKAIAVEASKYGLDMNRVSVIRSALQPAIIESYQPFKKNETKPFKIISIGRFHWIKGIKYAIDACRILKNEGFDFQFTYVASNAIDQETQFQIEQLDLKDEINILTALDQSQLFNLIRGSDVLLLTSLAEGIANVVLEAMALGVPVISTDCEGMKEVVIHKTTGWLVPKRDADAISKAILEVSQTSEADLESITVNAYQLVKKEFDEADNLQKFHALYQRVLRE
ncbi:MAG: glycosyltransferase family 4 protein [Flavobacteriaceae bacterium]|nr:glycosyltransferase family 4 protein [Flavobacteriaceae bacterium]